LPPEPRQAWWCSKGVIRWLGDKSRRSAQGNGCRSRGKHGAHGAGSMKPQRHGLFSAEKTGRGRYSRKRRPEADVDFVVGNLFPNRWERAPGPSSALRTIRSSKIGLRLDPAVPTSFTTASLPPPAGGEPLRKNIDPASYCMSARQTPPHSSWKQTRRLTVPAIRVLRENPGRHAPGKTRDRRNRRIIANPDAGRTLPHGATCARPWP